MKPQQGNLFNIYCCGPTVYGRTHVGNARAALTLDLVTRILQWGGYKTKVARNYTDIDDKIIEAAKTEGMEPLELARKYEKYYSEEMEALGTHQPDFSPRATEYIPAMLEMIQLLEKKGLAYQRETLHGTDVYFRVEKFTPYGKLSHRRLKDMLSGARIEPEEAKDSPADFTLWKAAKAGEPAWDSPWGQGRPGWHIECSAMVNALFNTPLDIHMGGLDLIFPHHENETAQSEGAKDEDFVRYWIHNGLIEIGEEKMSKSLGNIFKTHEFLNQYGSEVLRLMIYQQHYRSPIDFSEEAILRAEMILQRMYTAKREAANKVTSAGRDSSLVNELTQVLMDDFNSAKAIGRFLKQMRTAFREGSVEAWQTWQSALELVQKVFGLLEREPMQALNEINQRRLDRMGVSAEFSQQIEQKLEERERLRKIKEFQKADAIRDELEKEGVMVMDSPDGSHWTMKLGK